MLKSDQASSILFLVDRRARNGVMEKAVLEDHRFFLVQRQPLIKLGDKPGDQEMRMIAEL